MLYYRSIEWLGYLAALLLYLHLRKRFRRGPALTAWQGICLACGMVLGSAAALLLARWLTSMPTLWQSYGDIAVPPGQQTGLAAMLGGWFGLECAKRYLKITHPSGDVFVFPMMLAMAVARLAKFMDTSAARGLPTSFPWGVNFGDGIARHPVQLYEALCLAILAGIFLWRMFSLRQRGCMFSQFAFAYLAFTFLVEFLKPHFVLVGVPLSMLQLAAIAGMAHAIWHWNDQCCSTPFPTTPAIEHHDTEFVELTTSLCPTCLKKIDAKVLIDHGSVFLQKFCPDHGLQRVLIADDAAYWRDARRMHKPPTSPLRRNTAMSRGCPYDCGLCPDHEQHSCLAIIEITQKCDLACPICYACSTPSREHRTLDQINFMLDCAVANEGLVNVVQFSGGEPTLHPDLFAIMDAVKARPIRHMMLNTNGRRIATDEPFVQRLASYMPGFELYLQFDSLRPQTLRQLRGADLSQTRRRAVEMLEKHGISTTLVVTLAQGINDDQIGEILDFAISHRCIRGVTFQPIQAAGRLDGFDPQAQRLTLTAVRNAILKQHKLFTPRDLVPVPCHTDALAMGYAIRRGGRMIPLSKLTDVRSLLSLGGNTICYEQDPRLRQHVMQLFSASASPSSAADDLNNLCCEAADLAGGAVKYQDVFRVIIMQFMDAWSMDLRSLKRSCVHIVQPDGRLIPFETCNLLHRSETIVV